MITNKGLEMMAEAAMKEPLLKLILRFFDQHPGWRINFKLHEAGLVLLFEQGGAYGSYFEIAVDPVALKASKLSVLEYVFDQAHQTIEQGV